MNINFKNIEGLRFGRLIAISLNGKDNYGKLIWNCKCDCGNSIDIIGESLRRGSTNSCGCLRRETHNGQTHGLSKYKEYKSWKAMKSRCYNINVKNYKDYGGRGITICDEWKNDFTAFIKDMGRKPSENYSIDRIDNNGNYCKGNCRWATDKEQANNKSINHYLEYDNQKLTMSQWAEKLNISIYVIRRRINSLNWSIEKTLTTPVRNLVKNTIPIFEYNGESLTLTEWSKKININKSTLHTRLSLNWSVEKIVTTPVRKMKKRIPKFAKNI